MAAPVRPSRGQGVGTPQKGRACASSQPSLLPVSHPFQVSLYVERSTDTSAGSSGPSHLQGA